MVYENGTKIKITAIQRKDYTWMDGEFEELSSLCNGQDGIILSHNPESIEFDERESYQVLVSCSDGTQQELEMKIDEFEKLS